MKYIIQIGKRFVQKQSPARLITMGFAWVILIGAVLLKLPISIREGVEVTWIDAFFTSTSAVCVTGLISIDTAEHFTVFGRAVVAMLIQIGGLGVTSVGVGIILVTGKRIGMKERVLVKEALNVSGAKGVVTLVKRVLLVTLCFETVGAILSFFAFVQIFPPLKAMGVSVFHSIATFNNAGFDILGGLTSLIPFRENMILNLTTCALIVFGGLGFLVILDLSRARSFKKLTLHSKVVMITSAILIVFGTVSLKFTEEISWMGALFQSISARTAGFSTYAIGDFTSPGLFVLIVLMFIGASPGSTGGGIKTSTLFVVLNSIKSMAMNRHTVAFRRKIPDKIAMKAFAIMTLSSFVVIVSIFVMCLVEPDYTFMQIVFECVSAFGTVGLSTGITPGLSPVGKIVIIIIMFIGRLGVLTIVTMWSFREPAGAMYTEENIAVG